MNTKELIQRIGSSKKSTPVKMYIKPKKRYFYLYFLALKEQFRTFRNHFIIYGEYEDVARWMSKYEYLIEDAEIEYSCRNSAIPLLDILELDARIEPGAIIREGVSINSHAVVLMGAIINVGASIGEETLVDMGAVIGGRAYIGKRCHIGANAVIAGVIEPMNVIPCVIEDDVLIGANAVILEGVRVGRGSIIGAGSIVLEDVLPNSVVVGNPGKVIKSRGDVAEVKYAIVDDLRKL